MTRAARAGAALVLLLPALLSLLVALPASAQDAPGAPAEQTTPGAAEPEAPVVVRVTTLAPRAPQPGGRLQVRGTLHNVGSVPVTGIRVGLRVGDRLSTRSDLAVATAEGPVTRRVAGTTVRPGDLPAGGTLVFDVRVAVDALPLFRDGAYPFEVEVRGQVADGDPGDVVGLATTFLPWFHSPPAGTTRIAWVWPLVADPVQGPRRTPRGIAVLDDGLATSLTPQGRLGRALRAARGAEAGACDQRPAGAPPATLACRGEPVGVTYALDGDLLDTVQGMASGYDVLGPGSTTSPGAGAGAAQDWAASLTRAVAPGGPAAGVLALPYADPDVVALTGPSSTLAGDVGQAAQLGRTRVQETTGRAPVTGLQLAPPGALTGDALEAYLGTGTQALVVDEQALPPRPAAQPATSGARNPLTTATGQLTGLVVDHDLSALLTPDPTADSWQGERLAEQRWIVESAMISAEDPDATRTLVVALPRDADVVPAVAAQELLDSGRLPWLCAVPLADAAAGREQCPQGGPVGGAAADRGATVAPAADAPTLTPEQLRAVGEARRQVDQLTGAVLVGSDPAAETRNRLLRGALRAESSAWRDPAARPRGRRLAGLLGGDVAQLLSRVVLLTSDVTLTSSTGQLRVNVENQLDQAVTVKVRLQASNAARLAVESDALTTVPPRNSVQIDLRADPRTTGRFPVVAQLLDRRGVPFGRPSQFVIRSTRYGTVALAVTGVGIGVLLVAAGVRLVRRALHR